MATLEVQNLRKNYGSNLVLNNVSAAIEQGELVTLLGPSGCGKTTLLRAIAGLTSITAGSVRLNDADITGIPIHRRNIGMVFQSHALFPNMTVAENVGFGLKMRGIPSTERQNVVRSGLSLVQLEALEDRMPHQLSGGQQQRVAIARAMATNPSLLLLDEPFGALDRKLRAALQVELRSLTKKLGVTAIFVTHDQEEAVILSDRIAVMNEGVIQQIGTPVEIYESPVNRFVADFMGFENVLKAELISADGGLATFGSGGQNLRVHTQADLAGSRDTALAIRSERIGFAAASATDERTNLIRGRVISSSYRGNLRLYDIDTDLGTLVVCANSHGETQAIGDQVVLELPPSELKFLN